MKKLLITVLAMICCLLCTTAAAAPAATDGTVTGWIDENGFLDWETGEGTVLQVPIDMGDILGILDGRVLCLTKDQRVLSVGRNGYQTLEITDSETLKDQRIQMKDGVLTFEETAVSEAAYAAVTDGSFLYYVEGSGDIRYLRVQSVRETEIPVLPGTRDALALSLSGRIVPDPLSMTVTREALTLTGREHQVVVMNLITGVVTEYPQPAGETTVAACLARNTLYRYTLSDDQKWIPESYLTPDPVLPAFTPAPTPAPTPVPTPRPTPVPASQADDDGTIYFGAYGKTVRRIQQRLADLGYPTGTVDGKYGDQTQLAINLFCDAIHFREHNYITARVQRKLFAADAPVYDPYLPLKKGDRGVSVFYMQVRLKELGYDPGKLDGIYGKLTVAAVALFQRDYEIPLAYKEIPGEVASREMLEKLFAPEPTPTAAPTQEPTPNPATQTDL